MKKICTLMLAIFAIVCANAQVYVYMEDFENGIPATWQNIDNDGDSFSWITVDTANDKMAPHSGLYSVSSASFDNPSTTVLHPDNWLITDTIAVPEIIINGITAPVYLSWWDAAQDPNYPSDHYEVYISTTGNTIADFTDPAVFTKTLTTSTWTNRTVDITAYAGQKIYVAFVHNNCSDQFMMKLDDIAVYYMNESSIAVTPSSIGFGTNFVNTHSNIYTVTLTTALIGTDIDVTTNAPFEISTDSVNWATTLSISPATTTIAARYSPLVTGSDIDTILFTYDTLSAFVALTGTAIDSCSLDPTGLSVLWADESAAELTWNALTTAGYTLEMIELNDTAWTTVFTDQTFSNPVLYTVPVQKGSIYEFRLKQHCIGDTIYSGYIYTICMTPPFTGAYAHSCYPDYNLYKMDVNDPANATPIWKSPINRRAYAGCYYNEKYYYVSNNKEFMVVDLTTLQETVLDTLPNAVRDMAYDYAKNIMYGIEGDTLCTFDPNTGARMNPIAITGLDSGSSAHVMAVDLKSNIYTIDFSKGNLYTLDAATGAATLVGSTGLSMSYIQAMTYDPNTGVMYWANYDSKGQLYTVDPVTAQTNLRGALCTADGNEVGALFFPYTFNPEAPGAPSITVVPDPNFGTSGDITVVNLTDNVLGDPFSGTVDSIIVTRNGEVIYVETVNTALGSTFTFTDNDPDLVNCVTYTYEAYAMTSEGKSFVAMATAQYGDCCNIIFEMEDAYGDGWDDHAINVIVNGEPFASVTCEGSYVTEYLAIENGSSVTLQWEETSSDGWPEEISFSVSDAFGQQTYAHCDEGDAENYTDGLVLATFTHDCTEPTCFKPINLSVDHVDNTTASISWSDTVGNTLWIVEYGTAGFTLGTGTTATATTTSYTITGLTPNASYDIYVYADCGAEDGVSANITTSILTKVCADENRCPLRIEMHDGYGDGWVESSWFSTYYGYLWVTEDGQNAGYALLEDGYDETVTIDICEGANVIITWYTYGSLSYADEISFEIYLGDNMIASVADGSTLETGQVIKGFTNTCGVGIEENTTTEKAVTVYPNPTKDVLNVRAEGYNKVEVVNFLGQVVYSAQVDGSDFQISTSKLTSGVYFLRLSGDNVVTKKFVKE